MRVRLRLTTRACPLEPFRCLNAEQIQAIGEHIADETGQSQPRCSNPTLREQDRACLIKCREASGQPVQYAHSLCGAYAAADSATSLP